jgi:4-hydroxy-tetrahydrodipicolinate synthase
MRPYEGLLTAMITPFHADGRVNEDASVAIARHLLANGSHGLVVAGTTGEAATLTDEEQVRLVELIVREAGSEGAIVAGAGSNDTRHAVELTERVIGAGAHAVLSVTPYYNKPNRRGIVRHFSEVARAAGGTPVILYNIPGRTAVNMPPDLLAELAQIDGIVAVKQANSAELQPIDGLAVLAGNDDVYGACLDMGGAGGICVASHVVGPEMRRMYDEPEARAEIDASLRDVYETLFITASPTPVKAALNLLGHDAGTLRLPMVEADEAETAAVRAMLERHGLLSTVPTG